MPDDYWKDVIKEAEAEAKRIDRMALAIALIKGTLPLRQRQARSRAAWKFIHSTGCSSHFEAGLNGSAADRRRGYDD